MSGGSNSYNISDSLHFDEFNKISVLDSTSSEQINTLKKDLSEFKDNVEEFDGMSSNFVKFVDVLGAEVEKEKLECLGLRNRLKMVEKRREDEIIQLYAVVLENKMKLEKLKLEHRSLVQTEVLQKEFLGQFLDNAG